MVLVHYEDYALEHFKQCYESLKAQSFPREQFTIFVVNNGASKEADHFVRALSPEARHLSNGTNKGWAHANNLAIKTALDENYEYMVLLNMDAEVDKDWLLHLARGTEERPTSHIIQSKILLFGTNQINSMGNRIHFLGYGYCLGYGKINQDYKNDDLIDFVSGASMLVSAEVFRRIGFFDEEYFMYYDDMEFCWRARLAGFRVSLEPKSICYHKHNFHGKIKFLYHLEKNRLLTVFTLSKKRTLLFLAPALISAQLVSGVYFVSKGYLPEITALYRYFFKKKTRHYILSKRMKVRRLRKCSDSVIVKNFSPIIFFAGIQDHKSVKLANLLLSLYWKTLRNFIRW